MMATVIGLTGSTRSGKSWTAKVLKSALEIGGYSVRIVGQDDFWERTVMVTVAGKQRSSQEETGCTNHGAFAAEIRSAANGHAFVIAEGFQLLHSAEVVSQLGACFFLELSRDGARARRTQPRDRRLNPNPLSVKDFDELAWPAHEVYVEQSVRALVEVGKVVAVGSPSDEAGVTAIVDRVLKAVGLQPRGVPANLALASEAPEVRDGRGPRLSEECEASGGALEADGDTWFVKHGVTAHEHAMQLHAHASGLPAPRVRSFEGCSGVLAMERLPKGSMSLSDYYGEEGVPEAAFERVRALVGRMVDEAGLDFPDLTGYNFVATWTDPGGEVDQLWVVDFEHARRVASRAQCCAFVRTFLEGHNGWNPEFR